MKRDIKKQGLLRILSGGIFLFSLIPAPSARALSPVESSLQNPVAGVALLRHNRALAALTEGVFKSTVTNAAAHLPENAGDWSAVAMNGRHALFFYEPDFKMAVCTLDENGAPAKWLPLNYSLGGFTPVALENNRILIQRGPYGALAEVAFDDEGCFVSKKLLSENSQGWAARGMDTNRIILEHVRTGDVAIWAANPKGLLFRPYLSFILSPGWTVRDFAEDFVLIQQGKTGAVTLVELGNGYRAKKQLASISGNEGWCAVALAL